MKTIDKEAIEYADKKERRGCSYHSGLQQGFIDGIKFAQRWIPIVDDSPLAYETGEWDGKRSDFVLAKNKWGNVFIARTYEGVIDGNKFCDFAEKDDTILSHIIEWRPIERM
jgi:hypothetical protein